MKLLQEVKVPFTQVFLSFLLVFFSACLITQNNRIYSLEKETKRISSLEEQNKLLSSYLVNLNTSIDKVNKELPLHTVRDFLVTINYQDPKQVRLLTDYIDKQSKKFGPLPKLDKH